MRRPGLEGLEARALLAGDSIAVPFAEALVTSQAITTSGVAATSDGDFYVSGLFQGTVDFDPGPGVHEVTRTTQQTGVGDGFLAKYSARGDLLWVQTFAVPQGENLRIGNVATSGDRVVLVGSATAGVDLNPGSGTAEGTLGAFVLTFDQAGTFQSVERFTGPDLTANFPNGVALDGQGNTFLTGRLNGGTTDFDPGPGVESLTGTNAAYVVKLGADGTLDYASALQPSSGDQLVASAIAVGPDGRAYVVGSFTGTVDFDPSGAGHSLTTTGVGSDGFLLRLKADGTYGDVVQVGGADLDLLTDVTVDTTDPMHPTVLTLGSFSGTVDLGNSLPPLTNSGFADALIARWNTGPTLTPVSALQLGGDTTLTTRGIGIDDTGTIYLAGSYNGTLDLDPGPGTVEVTSAGTQANIFVESFDPSGTFQKGTSFGGQSVSNLDAVGFGPRGQVTLAGIYLGQPQFGDKAPPTATDIANVYLARASFLGDVLPPRLDQLGPVTPSPRNQPVDSVPVVFSEPIDASTFTVADLSLTRDGQPVRLNGVTIAPVAGDPTRYTIGGLGALTGTSGAYDLKVDATTISDPAGNAGDAAVTTSFTIDTVAPTVTVVGPVTPDLRNVPVSDLTVAFSEPIAAGTFTTADLSMTRDGQPVDLSGAQIRPVSGDPTRYQVIGLGGATAADGSYTLTVSGSNVTDLAGNPLASGGSTSFQVDATAPALLSLASDGPSDRTTPIGTLTVAYSPDVNPATVTAADLTLTHNGQPVALPSGLTVTPVDGTPGQFTIGGLATATRLPGRYVLTLTSDGVTDLAGNAATGSESVAQTVHTAPADYDGDGISDLAVYRYDPASKTGVFEIRLSSDPNGPPMIVHLGGQGDVPVQGDFDGDGKTDVAVFQPRIDANGDGQPDYGQWSILLSGSNNKLEEVPFGAPGTLDRPAPGDFDGDGKTDIATIRPNSDLTPGAAEWFIRPSSNVNGGFRVAFGAANGVDLPAVGDFDGDGKDDIATFRPVPAAEDAAGGVVDAAQWFILPTGQNTPLYGGGTSRMGGFRVVFGASGGNDQPVVADYNNDGRADIAAFRSTTDIPGVHWFLLPSSGQSPNFGSGYPVSFGNDGSFSAPGNYSAGGVPELAVFDAGTGQWRFEPAAPGSAELSSITFGNLGEGTVPVLAPLAFRLSATGNDPGALPTRPKTTMLGPTGVDEPGNLGGPGSASFASAAAASPGSSVGVAAQAAASRPRPSQDGTALVDTAIRQLIDDSFS